MGLFADTTGPASTALLVQSNSQHPFGRRNFLIITRIGFSEVGGNESKNRRFIPGMIRL